MSHVTNNAKKIIEKQITSLSMMMQKIDENFISSVEIISQAKGRVVVVGMGKSGIIGKKIAATMASTGTPAFFVHPGEAFHGDLGMIKPIDVVLMISNSGETEELIRLLPFLQYQNNKIIAMTGHTDSTLSKHAYTVLDIGVEEEACFNNLAPTSSTTATLVMGDALAITLAKEREFKPEDFARFHPGGSLGKKLLTTVADVMRKENIPICSPTDFFPDVINTITSGCLGLCLVMEGNTLIGIISDGDIRRSFLKNNNIIELAASDLMTLEPITIDSMARMEKAEQIMLENGVSALVVQDGAAVVGIVQLRWEASC